MTRNFPRRKSVIPDLVTKATAARIIGVARQNIDGFIVRGEVQTAVVAGQTLVTKASALAAALAVAERRRLKDKAA